MRLLLDIDGTLCSYPFKSMVKKCFNVDLDPLSIYAYDLADVLGVSTDSINDMFKEQVFGKPTFEDNALGILNEWHKENSIVIYTNRLKYMSPRELLIWITDNKIPCDGVDMNGTGYYDVYIDDSPAKLMSVKSAIKLLYAQSWNQNCLNITKELRRVNSWLQVKEVLNSFYASTTGTSNVQVTTSNNVESVNIVEL